VMRPKGAPHLQANHAQKDVQGIRAFFYGPLLVFLAVLLFLSFAWADSFLSYHERILKQNGEPLRGTVAIKIQILAPDVQDCVLYEENQTVSVVNGVFSLKIGEGDKAGSTQLADVFQNGKTLTGLSSCGGSYKADLNSGRLLKVLFRDEQSTDWEELPLQQSTSFRLRLNQGRWADFERRICCGSRDRAKRVGYRRSPRLNLRPLLSS